MVCGRRSCCFFPEPKRVFGGLLSLWNLYSDQGREKEEYLRWLGRLVGVSGYSLETRQVLAAFSLSPSYEASLSLP